MPSLLDQISPSGIWALETFNNGSFFKRNRPAPIIAHWDVDHSSGSGQCIQQFSFNEQFDPLYLKKIVLPIVNGFSNPTDWSFDSISSPGYVRPIKNTYDGTALGDKPDIKVRKVNVAAILHMKC